MQIHVFLAFKPSFKKRPLEAETYAAVQGNVTLKCNPEAAPKPKFSWKKNGNVIRKVYYLIINLFFIIIYFFSCWRS